MEIEYAKICEKGLSREENQDAVFTCKTSEMAFFLVADGMGGHSHGEEASQMLVMACAEWCKCFSERKYESDFSKMISTIRKMLMDTNQKVREEHKGSVCGAGRCGKDRHRAHRPCSPCNARRSVRTARGHQC